MIEAWRDPAKAHQAGAEDLDLFGPGLHPQLVSAIAQHAEVAFDHFGGSAASAPEKGRIDVHKGVRSAQNSGQRSL